MQTKNTYAKYSTLDSKQEVLDYINEGAVIYSNHKDYRTSVNKLINYRESVAKDYTVTDKGNKYRNIYAHQIKIGIPKYVTKEKWHEFIKLYIYKVNIQFKKILYLYKLSTSGDGNYAEIVFFTRHVYKKARLVNKTYNQDYYYDKKTGQRCAPYFFFDEKGNRLKKEKKGCIKKENPMAVLKAKKGRVIVGKNGCPETLRLEVKPNEEVNTTFRYKSFNKFTAKLHKKILIALQKLVANVEIYKVISRVTISTDDSKVVRKAKLFKNDNISEVNKMLIRYQDSLKQLGIEEKEVKFDSFLEKVNVMIYQTREDFKIIKSFINKWWLDNVLVD